MANTHTLTLLSLFALAGCSGDPGGPWEETLTIEILSFEAKDKEKWDDEKVVEHADRSGDVLRKRAGFLARWVARSEDDHWLVINFWRDREAIDDALPFPTLLNPRAFSIMRATDNDTFTTTPYDLLAVPASFGELSAASALSVQRFSVGAGVEDDAVLSAALDEEDALWADQEDHGGRFVGRSAADDKAPLAAVTIDCLFREDGQAQPSDAWVGIASGYLPAPVHYEILSGP